MLPDIMVPYKHYAEAVINDAVNDQLDLSRTNDAPSPSTIDRWKRWIKWNTTDIDGHLKSIGHRELGFAEELTKSRISLLKELMRSIPDNWLRTIIRMIYNTGACLIPVYS